jgi:hypothetical protein
MENKYFGRILDCRKVENILIVWVAGDPLASFEVKRRAFGDIYAYGFNGDFSVEEIAEAKRMFEAYEEV